jgi:hypothetical protein
MSGFLLIVYHENRIEPAPESSGPAVGKIADRPKLEPKPTANHAEPTLFCPMDWTEEPDWCGPGMGSDIY